jgi:hypothetical protein
MTKNKIILMVVAISATLLPSQTASANIIKSPVMLAQKSLVIIDYGINTELDWIARSIIDEACFVEFHRCPNGFSEMSGVGASKITPAMTKSSAFSHGTQMASIAVAIDPRVQIVSIRVVGMNKSGMPSPYSPTAILKALEYVEQNKTRLNVGAVSISLGRSYRETACPINSKLQSVIANLTASGVGVVIAVGNGGNNTKVDYPACIPEAIAVGATEDRYAMKEVEGWVYPILSMSNNGPELDLFVNGKYTVTDISNTKKVSFGTSGSTVAFATYLNKMLTLGQTLPSVMTSVNASLVKAYRGIKDFYPKQFDLTNS